MPSYSQTVAGLFSDELRLDRYIAENLGLLSRSQIKARQMKAIVNGKAVLENIFDDVRSDLLYCEPDLGWIDIGGGDPAYYLKKYKDRCPVIHFKDYIPAETDGGFLFRPTGYGIMNNAELYALSKPCNPEWYIMDHDCAYERDSYFDLSISLEYFKNLMTVTD